MRRNPLTLLLAALALAAPAPRAHAYFPPTPVQNILFGASSPADLRARLLAHADSVEGHDPLDAGEAWYHLGLSHARAGHADSARTAFARAIERRGNPEERLALADLLLARGVLGSPDSAGAGEALRVLEPQLRIAREDPGLRGAALRLREAWAQALGGQVEAARAVFARRPVDLFSTRFEIPDRTLWARRFGALAVETGEGDAAWRLLAPLVALTRGRDSSVVRLARAASAGYIAESHFADWLADAVARADSDEIAPLGAPRPRALSIRTVDGFALRAWLVPARRAATAPPLAVVVAAADPTSLASCDSLVAQLRRAGLAIALLDPRGSRASLGPGCVSADAWHGREEAFERRLAKDLGAAIAPAARALGANPARVVLVGEGPACVALALAANGDPRVRAMVLAGAAPSPVERGWLRAAIASARVPVFFQTGPEDIYGNEAIDRIVAMLPPQQVRVADSRGPGAGAALFRAGPAVGRRLADWLSDAWSRPPAPPPARRRRG